MSGRRRAPAPVTTAEPYDPAACRSPNDPSRGCARRVEPRRREPEGSLIKFENLPASDPRSVDYGRGLAAAAFGAKRVF